MKSGRLHTLGGIRYGNDLVDQITSTKTELFGPYSSNSIPNPGQSASLDEWLPWILNRLKAITGETEWWNNPDASIADLYVAINNNAPPNALLKTANLIDLTDVSIARLNLGLDTAALYPVSHFSLSTHTHTASLVASLDTVHVTASNVQEALEGLDTYITNLDIDGGFF
jgi:hypothetical protein